MLGGGDPLFTRLSGVLDDVPAIDNHAHLGNSASYDPSLEASFPFLLKRTNPLLPGLIKSRFGVDVAPDDWRATLDLIGRARQTMIARRGRDGYWHDHLDATRTEIALINTSVPARTNGTRLKWVPPGSLFLYPLAVDPLVERSPHHKRDIPAVHQDLQDALKQAGQHVPRPNLRSYLQFVDATLIGWQKAGAVAIKFGEAYFRTLRIADVPEGRATSLYLQGLKARLTRDEYLELQDFLWRHTLLTAGELRLPVHIHVGPGNPPFLRTLEADPRNLEDVLADPRFFNTPIVLIHSGGEIGAYLSPKPNVWFDISSVAFTASTRDVADLFRRQLMFASNKMLFGTNGGATPTIPDSDVVHLLLSRATRDALTLALTGLVRDGVLSEEQAIEMGRGVLRENARRLYLWN